MNFASAREKIDVIDLIINVLSEHEGTLDRLIERLDTLIRYFEQYIFEDKINLLKKIDTSTGIEILTDRIQLLEQQIKKNQELLEYYLTHEKEITITSAP